MEWGSEGRLYAMLIYGSIFSSKGQCCPFEIFNAQGNPIGKITK